MKSNLKIMYQKGSKSDAFFAKSCFGDIWCRCPKTSKGYKILGDRAYWFSHTTQEVFR